MVSCYHRQKDSIVIIFAKLEKINSFQNEERYFDERKKDPTNDICAVKKTILHDQNEELLW